MTKAIKISIFVSLILIAALAFLFISLTQASTVEKDINDLIKDYNERLANPSEEDTKLFLSSNPYDFVEDNMYYDRIVAQGVASLAELEEISKSSDSFTQYILAIAVEDIIKVDLKASGYTSDFFWDTGDKFLVSLSEYKKFVSKEVESIVTSDIEISEKEEKLKELGVLAVPYIYNFVPSTTLKEFGNSFKEYLEVYGDEDIMTIKKFTEK